MADARLRVTFAGPLVTFQDGGRFGKLRFGVPASGPMDRLSHAAANLAIGNDARATAIEVSLGGVALECSSGAVTVAVTGGAFEIEHAGATRRSWCALTIHAGERLTVRPGISGSWAYVAVAGELDVPCWLGHTATHSMSGFGGGALTAGRDIDVADARTIADREGAIPFPEFGRPTGRVRVVMGPQDHHFEAGAITAFGETTYALTDAYDRMGVRLSGAALALRASLSIPSEPIIRGSVQVAGDGVPTVLLADHQTTGGYPKIATVISADIDGFAQLRAGDLIRFDPITPSDAITAARARAAQHDDYLEQVSTPRGTLNDRLLGQNLIGGAISTLDDDGCT